MTIFCHLLVMQRNASPLQAIMINFSQHCGSILSRSQNSDHDLIFISTMSRSFMRKAVKHADEAPLKMDKFLLSFLFQKDYVTTFDTIPVFIDFICFKTWKI